MSPGTKIALGLVGGVVVGGAAGYLIANTRHARRALKAAQDVLADPSLRLPDPSFAVELAYSEEQFALLDDLVCECGTPAVKSATESTTVDEVVQQIQSCMAEQLYPSFTWPPISGDHPTVAQLYGELGLIARRAVIDGTICPEPIPSPTNIPTPVQNPGGYR